LLAEEISGDVGRNSMTELLYQTDSYLKEVEGQPADRGVIAVGAAEWPVAELKKKSETVWHILKDAPPEKGSPVIARLDWDHRYKLMRTHTAFHILCGVIFRDYGALVTGGNMKPLEGRMDFEFEHMTADFATEVEASINKEVAAARPVVVRILPREEAFQIPDLIRTKINLLPESIREVRVVEIVGLDVQADGGTHVANTREVGHIRVVGHESKGKINKRLRIEIDA
jgi:misacylated tRNA(Ala) deacylase